MVFYIKVSMSNVTLAQFSYNITKVNAWFEEQNKIILAAEGENCNYAIQLFYCYLTCLV